jgi:hypothetical protein
VLRNCINLVAGFGIFGVIIGVMDYKYLLPACVLVGAALIAAAIASPTDK